MHGACTYTYHPPIHFIAPTTIPPPVLFIPSLYYTSYNSKNCFNLLVSFLFLVHFVQHSLGNRCMMLCTTASDNNMQWCFPIRKPTLRMLRRMMQSTLTIIHNVYTSMSSLHLCAEGPRLHRWERMQSIA